MAKKGEKTTVAQDKDEIVTAIPAACSDELAAVEFFERHRWGDTPACPKCGDTDVYQMKARDGSRARQYRWRCRGCKGHYSVRTGTVMEESRIPLRHWAYAFWRGCTSKKGVSSLEIKRHTGLSYKSALFLMHRIRYAMAPVNEAQGQLTGTVEADETYVGGKPRNRHKALQGWRKLNKKQLTGRGSGKTPVMAIVQRGGGVRARVVPNVTAKTLQGAIHEHVHPSARIMTDEWSAYKGLRGQFEGGHHSVTHSRGEYVRGDVYTNTVEGFFSLLKRGIYGTFHNVSKRHLHRYVSEFEFRYNTRKMTDGQRVAIVIREAEGKRLRYNAPIRPQQKAQ